jgi:steroid delta-isomerase-like uncharacterized protein
MMGTEHNETIVRQWMEAWNGGLAGLVRAVDDLMADDYVRHDPNAPEVRGREAQKQLVTMFLTAFDDFHLTIEDLLAEGDKVAGRLTARATHKGELFGIPPTGRQVTVSMLEIYRLAGGKIAEQWFLMDALGLMQQLGAIPMPEGAGA